MSEKQFPAGVVTARFDWNNPSWSKTYGINRMFLHAQLGYANQILADRGYLTLNEVYDMLSLPQTEQGALAGWVGDTEVSFGEEADSPPPGSSIALVFNINSTNVFHDK